MTGARAGWVAAALAFSGCSLSTPRLVESEGGVTGGAINPSSGGAGGVSAGGSGGGGRASGGTSGVGGTPEASSGGAGSDDGGDAGTPAVVGRVSVGGQVAPAATVFIDGVKHVTDAQGRFTVPGAGGTYDAMLVGESDGVTYASVYLGLSTRRPYFQVAQTRAIRAASLSGRLSGGTGFPNPATSRVTLGCVSSGVLLGTLRLIGGEGPDYGPLELEWPAPLSTLQATLFALQFTLDPGGLPTGYTGWAAKSLEITAGDAGSLPGADLALQPVVDRTVSGTVELAAGLSLASKELHIGAGPAGVIPVRDTTPATLFQYRVPSGLAGVDTTLHAFAEGPGGIAHTFVRLADSVTTQDLVLLSPPVPTLPEDGATGVGDATAFTFAASAGAARLFEVADTAGTLVIDVYTMNDEARLPDLSAAGVTPKGGVTYTWTVSVSGPATLDELVEPFPYFDTHGRYADAVSTARTFTAR